MFNSKKIKTLERENKNLKRQLEEEINDLILILEQIQETNNTAMQWKHRQKTINNTIDLATERMAEKKKELGTISTPS
mgnify:CR=1 FL=1